jgi:putative PIN family toxin of toxin-antitoxin system
MRVVLDTNVFVSGVFFSGAPSQILEAWSEGRVTLVLSREILEEYRRVSDELHAEFPELNLDPFLALVAVKGVFVEAAPLAGQVSADPDDDRFLACALSGGCSVVVSGDKHLLDASGCQGITVLRPRAFVDRYLS